MADANEPLMERHRERKETTFVPWWARPSESGREITFDGTVVRYRLVVAGLGVMEVTATTRPHLKGILVPETIRFVREPEPDDE